MTESSYPADENFENLLTALTDAMLENGDMDDFLRRSETDHAELRNLLNLVRKLREVLTPIQPSRAFEERLRTDLIGVPADRNVVSRIRRLPFRVQMAAGLALLAGFVFVTRRRMSNVPAEKTNEGQEAAYL